MPAQYSPDDVKDLFARFERKERRGLARLLTLATDGTVQPPWPIALPSDTPVIGVTGSAGVGKSSLVGALARQLAAQGESVGILACDPQSPLTGGALLGDRCRMSDRQAHEKIFIRSLATPSGSQGVPPHLPALVELMRGFGFEYLFVETVGAGQGDTAVRNLVDQLVLVVQPQTGDELQWEKAGILEVADVVVVNKGDLPGADRTVAELVQQLDPPRGRPVPVIKTSVSKNVGIDDLLAVLTPGRQPEPRHPSS